MDPLDVMINIEQVLPYFQPIISADKQLVVGYEVKVYLQNGNQTEPLDWFFQDHAIPADFRQDLETRMLQLALESYMKTDRQAILFFYV